MTLGLNKIIATGFLSGLLPCSPGTWGSAGYVLFWYAISALGFDNSLISQTALLTTIGVVGFITTKNILQSNLHSQETDKQKLDPPYIVIDEWLGMAISLIGTAPSSYLKVAFAFLLFRIFDILKPWPIKKFERLPGALGVMADDAVAGVLALVVLKAISIYVL